MQLSLIFVPFQLVMKGLAGRFSRSFDIESFKLLTMELDVVYIL